MRLALLSLVGLLLFVWPFLGLGLPPDALALTVAAAALVALVVMESAARRLDSRGLLRRCLDGGLHPALDGRLDVGCRPRRGRA